MLKQQLKSISGNHLSQVGYHNYLKEFVKKMILQSQGDHIIDAEERRMERGSARQSSLKGQERASVNQMNTGTVSTATLWKLL